MDNLSKQQYLSYLSEVSSEMIIAILTHDLRGKIYDIQIQIGRIQAEAEEGKDDHNEILDACNRTKEKIQELYNMVNAFSEYDEAQR